MQGRSVTVFDQSSEVGGRARTTKIGDFYFNQEPHALYLSGAAARILQELGIEYNGNPPPFPAISDKRSKKISTVCKFIFNPYHKVIQRFRQ